MEEKFSKAQKIIRRALFECQSALSQLQQNQDVLRALEAASQMIVTTLKNGGKILTCGNGGSMSDAMHMAEEFSGRFRQDRPALAAMALSDPAHMTCVANDFGYAQVFARMVEALGSSQDCLVALSTSGKSINVIEAAKKAQLKGMKVISLTGRKDCLLSQVSDLDICTESGTKYADRVQELHIKCIHILLELCEDELFSSKDLKIQDQKEQKNATRAEHI